MVIVYFFGDNLITWRSQKQGVIAHARTEALPFAVCELLWLKITLDDLRIKKDKNEQLICDNRSAINIAKNPIDHDRTKHIEVDKHFIKEKIDAGLITLL